MQIAQLVRKSDVHPESRSSSGQKVAVVQSRRDDPARAAETSRNGPDTGRSFLTILLQAFSMSAA